jgi:hypothetical protein
VWIEHSAAPETGYGFSMMEGSTFAIGICQINGNGSAVNQKRLICCIDAEQKIQVVCR